MRTITDWGQAFLSAIGDALSKIFSFLPDLIGALLILWIGFIIAKILGRITADLLRKIRFNQAADKAGLSRFVQSAGVKQDASGVMGEIVKWFFRIIALVAAFSVLQLPALTAALTGILNFIPNLAIALVIVLIGGLLANFVADFIKGALSQAGLGNAGLFANIARYAIIYVAAVAALGQIGVASTVINTLWIGTVAALALALGLAFGLGGRDTAAKLLDNAYTKTQQNLPRMSEAVKQRAQQSSQRLPSPQSQPTQTYNPNQTYPQPTQSYAAGSTGYTQPQGQPQPRPQAQPQPQQRPQGQPQVYNTPDQGYYAGGQGQGQGQQSGQGGYYNPPPPQQPGQSGDPRGYNSQDRTLPSTDYRTYGQGQGRGQGQDQDDPQFRPDSNYPQ